MSQLPNDHDLFLYFDQQIKKEGQRDLKILEEKIAVAIEEKTKDIHVNLKAKYDLKLSLVEAELKHQHDERVRQYETALKISTGSKRTGHVQRIFHMVERKILAFIQSNDYPKFILSWIKLAAREHQEKMTFFGKKDDLILQNVLKENFPQMEWHEDPSIRWGGVYVQFDHEKTRLDLTIDRQWKEAQQRYYEQGFKP